MYKRKTFIVNKEFQYGLIATFLIIVLCSLVLFSTGFIVYYLVTGLAGENAFDEFITISRQVTIRIQELSGDDFAKPGTLAEKIRSAPDAVSRHLRENLSVKDFLEIDPAGAATDDFALRKKLASFLNFFLQNAIRETNYFYSPDRFKGVTLTAATDDLIRKKPDPQSAEAYRLNLRLLTEAYPEELKVVFASSDADLSDFMFQRVEQGRKRYELVLPPVIINNLVLMVIIMVVGVFYSHRIAGPLYRMEQDMVKVLSGEKNVTVRLRRKDKLKPFAEQLNRLINEIDRLRGK